MLPLVATVEEGRGEVRPCERQKTHAMNSESIKTRLIKYSQWVCMGPSARLVPCAAEPGLVI